MFNVRGTVFLLSLGYIITLASQLTLVAVAEGGIIPIKRAVRLVGLKRILYIFHSIITRGLHLGRAPCEIAQLGRR